MSQPNEPITYEPCRGCGESVMMGPYWPEPLCAICKQDNYVLFVGGCWVLFANSGQPHHNIPGIVSLAKFKRAKARRLNQPQGTDAPRVG